MAPRESLNVTIAGGGLAGLLAARVLREHHKVIVYESGHGNREVGVAVTFGPTAKKIVEGLGFVRDHVGSLTSISGRTFDMHGNVLHETDFTTYKEDADCLMNHRVALWEEFYRLATCPSADLGIGGDPAKVEFDVPVVDVDPGKGEVTLKDGRKIVSDLVIAADGITSICRPIVTGLSDTRTARPAGTSAFRFVLPAEKLRAINPDLDVIDPSRRPSIDVHVGTDGSHRSVVMYPISDYSLVNFVCLVPDSLVVSKETSTWAAGATTESLMRCYDDWGPYVKNIVCHASGIKLWRVRDYEPLPTYCSGRTILIGDSAHAMTPHAAQGATQAIEDTEAFELFNDPDVDRAAVPEILKQIDRVRRPRASQVQRNSRKAQGRRSHEEIWESHFYHMTYPGVRECLRRLDAGQEMIPVKAGNLK